MKYIAGSICFVAAALVRNDNIGAFVEEYIMKNQAKKK